MGHDPVDVCGYFGRRDRINHVHFRNVRVRLPNEKYTEVFLDEGDVNMFAVMQELVRQKYLRLIFPEHPRLMRTAICPGSDRSIQAAEVTRGIFTTSAMREPCFRRPCPKAS